MTALRSLVVALTLAPLVPALAAAPRAPSPAARAWWSHVEYLADDAREGRNAGSPGHRQAADYVARVFAEVGARPGGVAGGYLQPVALESRKVVEEKTRLVLVRDGRETPLVLGEDVVVGARAGQEGTLEAPLVFVGYGLSIPEASHDDLKGLDLEGKVVVLMTGGPERIPGALRAHHGSLPERWKALERAGAVGLLTVINPRFQEVPWERTALPRLQPSMVLADPALQEAGGVKLTGQLNPARVQRLFEGSGHTFEEIVAAADAERPLPRFALPARLKSTLVLEKGRAESQNVVGVIPGTDPKLEGELVVLSAHLDHVGVGAPLQGDAIYNGAMDNASGVASLLEIARLLKDQKPRRTVVLAAVTAEEKGLLGSRYFAARPSVPGRMVANLNMDMFLPLFPLRQVTAYGIEESTLSEPVRKVMARAGVKVGVDPEPNRNVFVRSDQYNFIREGVPALAFKFGFDKGSREEKLQRAWYAERYHGPKDDLTQPVDREAAARFTRLLGEVALEVANAPRAPEWRPTSFFRRFAKDGAQGGAAR